MSRSTQTAKMTISMATEDPHFLIWGCYLAMAFAYADAASSPPNPKKNGKQPKAAFIC
jgi:hypothetical protein